MSVFSCFFFNTLLVSEFAWDYFCKTERIFIHLIAQIQVGTCSEGQNLKYLKIHQDDVKAKRPFPLNNFSCC